MGVPIVLNAPAPVPASFNATPPVLASVGATSVQLLAANQSRKRLLVQNTGTTILYLVLGALAPTATVYHVALKGCTAANDGTGATYIDEMWQGPLLAIGSAGGGTCIVEELI